MAVHAGISVLVLSTTLLVTAQAQAALIGRLPDAVGAFQAVYDTELNITWLADANYAAASGYAADGRMKWHAAQDWIGSLNAAVHLGFDDWRLPYSDGCTGYDCTGSELGHLFYTELGGVAGFGNPMPPLDHPNLSLFANLQTGSYWSASAFSDDAAWAFEFGPYDVGRQIYYPTFYKFNAWAVRNGDVAPLTVHNAQAMVVPLPAAAWLLGGGLAALFVVSRNRAD